MPVRQPVTLTVNSHLLINDSVTDQGIRASIIQEFASYNWSPANPDAIAYAQAKINAAGITPSMFQVRQSFVLTKVGPAVEDLTQVNAIKSLYGIDISPAKPPTDSNGRSGGTLDFTGSNEPIGGQFLSQGFELTLINTSAVGSIPAKVADPVHQIEGKQNVPPDFANIIAKDSTGMDCNKPLGTVHQRLMTVFAYPEFEIKWEAVSIRIGCINVVISIPALYMRISAVVLYGYVGTPNGIAQWMVSMVEGCIVKAVLAGAILGIVLDDFAAALAAFRAVFVDCCESIPGQTAMCLVPGLALVTEPQGDWTKVL